MTGRRSIFGIILVFIGIALLLSSLGIQAGKFLLPLGLIILGAWLIWRKKNRTTDGIRFEYHVGNAGPTSQPGTGGSATFHAKAQTAAGAVPPDATVHATWSAAEGPSATASATSEPRNESGPNWTSGGTASGSGKVKYSKFLGDLEVDCRGVNMQDVEISGFAGDLRVDLRGARLAEGLNRLIISSFMGDVELLVPRGMPVYVHSSGFAGDVDLLGRRSSGFGITLDGQTDTYDSATAKLYIAVSGFVGDVRVTYI